MGRTVRPAGVLMMTLDAPHAEHQVTGFDVSSGISDLLWFNLLLSLTAPLGMECLLCALCVGSM